MKSINILWAKWRAAEFEARGTHCVMIKLKRVEEAHKHLQTKWHIHLKYDKASASVLMQRSFRFEQRT
jgi:hypothetical protein